MILLISGMIVRVGAVALRMTGVPMGIALFQSVSAYTRTGFTTKEAEMVVMDPLRRNIIAILIYLGNAGIASFFITLINATAAEYNESPSEKIIYIGVIFIIILFLNYLMFSKRAFKKFDNFFETYLKKRFLFTNLHATQIVAQKTGYGPSIIPVKSSYPVCGKSAKEFDFSSKGIIFLGVLRGDKYTPMPSADEKILNDDSILVYGEYKNIIAEIYSKEMQNRFQAQHLHYEGET